MRRSPLREPVRVLMHLDGGYTKVALERTQGVGLANGGIDWDIPTHNIPAHLRSEGARFIIVTESIWPDDSDTAEELAATQRQAIEDITIVEADS